MSNTANLLQSIEIAHTLLEDIHSMEVMIEEMDVLMNPSSVVPSDEILISSLQNQINLLQNHVKTLQYQLDLEREFNREISWLFAAENEERRRLTGIFTHQNAIGFNSFTIPPKNARVTITNAIKTLA